MQADEKELVLKHIEGLRDLLSDARHAISSTVQSPLHFVVFPVEKLEPVVRIAELSLWAIEDIVQHSEDCQCVEEPPCW